MKYTTKYYRNTEKFYVENYGSIPITVLLYLLIRSRFGKEKKNHQLAGKKITDRGTE